MLRVASSLTRATQDPELKARSPEANIQKPTPTISKPERTQKQEQEVEQRPLSRSPCLYPYTLEILSAELGPEPPKLQNPSSFLQPLGQGLRALRRSLESAGAHGEVAGHAVLVLGFI